jgi:AsmA protein
MKKQKLLMGAILAFCLVVAALWVVTHPTFAISQLQEYVLRKTGRTLLVNGGAQLQFAPRLAVRLGDAAIANPEGMAGEFIQADYAVLPIQVSDLFSRKLKIREIALVNPRFNLLVDTKGRSNWIQEKTNGGADATEPGKLNLKSPITIQVENGTVSFLDERHGQTFSAQSANGSVTVGESAELDISGTVAINSQFANFNAHIASLRRIPEDGSPADLTITAPALDLNFSGRLGTASALNLAGVLDAKSADVRQLAKWMGTEIKGRAGLKDFSMAGALDVVGDTMKLTKASVQLDGMTATGDVALDFIKKKPLVTASLSTDLLSLDPYLETSSSEKGNADAGPADWDVKPLDLSALKGINGNLALSAFRLKWRGMEIRTIDITSSLQEGILTSSFTGSPIYDGTGNAKVVLDGSQSVPALQVAFDGRSMAGAKFFAQVFGLDWITGTTTIATSLSTFGNNKREMMSSLKGSFSIAVSDGAFKGLDIVDSISKLSSKVLQGWGDVPEHLTAFNSMTASFAVEDGIAKSTDVKLESPVLTISGAGEVDMLRRAVDFKFDPELATGDESQAGLPVQVAVKGPWDKPRIYPNIDGILENPEAAYDSLRELGLSEKTFKKAGKKGKKFLNKLIGN